MTTLIETSLRPSNLDSKMSLIHFVKVFEKRRYTPYLRELLRDIPEVQLIFLLFLGVQLRAASAALPYSPDESSPPVAATNYNRIVGIRALAEIPTDRLQEVLLVHPLDIYCRRAAPPFSKVYIYAISLDRRRLGLASSPPRIINLTSRDTAQHLFR
ncbi:hypothetical protein E2P81_ATG03840 [Venturia nashicola]|uniref:Uncharacterized protein n=1 Tax=Venturia nashicola TaxID=86259 RepID=A0A4Z1PJW1_9PEZI|nr:hypothetical protein E6O75_ATG03934 [Venturia nashicola]TLD38165.1 hypothetical protein E2P81_ATG03840 [Venturia nashicola]